MLMLDKQKSQIVQEVAGCLLNLSICGRRIFFGIFFPNRSSSLDLGNLRQVLLDLAQVLQQVLILAVEIFNFRFKKSFISGPERVTAWAASATGKLQRKLVREALSKPNVASKYAFENSRRDLHKALLCTALKSQCDILKKECQKFQIYEKLQN